LSSTNNEAVIGGDLIGTLTEADASVSATGQLTISDIPEEQEFLPVANYKGLYGTFTLTKDGAWTYLTEADINGMSQGTVYTDSFVIQSKDGTLATVTMNITGTNDAPTFLEALGYFAGTALEDGSITDTVDAQDPEGASLSYSSPQPEHGSIVWMGNQWTYTPDADFYGTDTFTITLTDNKGATATHDYSVIVYGQPDAPVGTDKSVSIVENSNHTVVVGDFGFSDPKDAGTAVNQLASVIISAVSGPGKLWYNGAELDLSGGAVTITKADIDAGKLVWKSNADVQGQAQITFKVTDTGGGSESDHTAASTNTLTINVTADHAPTLTTENADAKVQAGGSLSLTIGDTHFSDVDGTDLTYAILVDGAAMPSWMTFDTATGAFVVTPKATNVGNYVITVTASDGSLTATDTFDLDVNPATSGSAIQLSNARIAENSASGKVIGALSGLDGNGDNFDSFTLDSNPDKMFKIVDGNLVVNKGASFDFETQSSYQVRIRATDHEGTFVTKTFTIKVTDVREDPRGTKGNDDLHGDAKDNIIDGGRGNDKLTGGGGEDTFVFGKAYGKDIIQDFDRKEGDAIDLSAAVGIRNYKDLIAHHVSEDHGSVKITTDDGSMLTIKHTDLHDLAKDMFLF
jgi:VCBS repeat-containing protein